MDRLPRLDPQERPRIVITDSGLGGLRICAGLERASRSFGRATVEIVYVNAWPEEGRGYNDLPDAASRAEAFDRALDALAALKPGLILIACNTLSILYGLTAFGRRSSIPVLGIVEEGVGMFYEALSRDPQGRLILFGTRTTIGSGEHVRRLSERGVPTERVLTVACHGLAGAIDRDPDDPTLPSLIAECAGRAVGPNEAGRSLYAGLACTHYAYVDAEFRTALEALSGSRVEVLDPGERLVARVAALVAKEAREVRGGPLPAVRVVSKVALRPEQRAAFARRLETLSPSTAAALLSYSWDPDLF